MMNKSYLIVLSLLVLYSSSLSDASSLPSFFKCSKEIVKYNVEKCLDDCHSDFDTDERINVTIFQSDKKEIMMKGVCSKVRRTTTLIKTWTFTEFPPQIIVENIPVDIEGCKSTWKNECNYGACVTSAPDINNDYQWAATREIMEIYYLMDIRLQPVPIHVNHIIMVNTQIGTGKYDSGYIVSDDQLTIHLWDTKVNVPAMCSLEPKITAKCTLRRTGLIYCRELGLLFNNSLSSSVCGVSIHEDLGLLFSTSRNEFYPGGTIEMSYGERIELVIDSLRGSIIENSHRLCASECLNLPGKQASSLSLIATQLLKKVDSGRYLKCRFLPDCKISNPIIFCRGPSIKILVICNGLDYWWSPNIGLEVDSDSCVPYPSNKTTVIINVNSETLKISQDTIEWAEDPSLHVYNVNPINHHDLKEIHDNFLGFHYVEPTISAHSSKRSDSTSRRLIFEDIWFFITDVWTWIYKGIVTLMILGATTAASWIGYKLWDGKKEKVAQPEETPEEGEEMIRYE